MLPPPQLEDSWKHVLNLEWTKPYMLSLANFLAQERKSGIPIYPAKTDVFNAFQYAPFEEVKVVIVGQDPYHGPNQAHGLCFSVPKNVPQPPSLVNIFKELHSDLGISPPQHGSLVSWAKQGILLLNTVLTVRAGQPQSHCGQGWEMFTDRVIECLCERKDPVIFVLWGKKAQDKAKNSSFNSHHNFLMAAHPSPFSAHSGFFGCRHFSKINNLLKTQDKEPIEWETHE